MSHLAPRPPSQVQPLTSLIVLLPLSQAGPAAWPKPLGTIGSGQVVFRSIMFGAANEYGGQADAGLDELLPVETPLASRLEIEGLECTTKLPKAACMATWKSCGKMSACRNTSAEDAGYIRMGRVLHWDRRR